MTVLVDISEYPRPQTGGIGSSALTGTEPALTYQQISASGTHAESAAFNAGTQLIRVSVDAACRIKIGAAPEAAAGTSFRMAAGVPEYFNVTPGHKLSVITTT